MHEDDFIAMLSRYMSFVTPQNVITIAAKCNTNTKCNNINAKCLNIFSHSFVSYTPVASMWFLPKHHGEFHRLSCVRTYARIRTATFDMF